MRWGNKIQNIITALFRNRNSVPLPEISLSQYVQENRIELRLQGSNKEEIINELVDVILRSLSDRERKQVHRDRLTQAMLDREKTMSTGMQHGIALPHAKTDSVRKLYLAIGIKREGIDFESLDGNLSQIFVAIASPKKRAEPHVRILSRLGTVLKDEEIRTRLINAETSADAAKIIQSVLN